MHKLYHDTSDFLHHPVLLGEALEQLSIKSNGIYLDCTFGAGGYTKAILEKNNCSIIALDQDPRVEKIATLYKENFYNRFHFFNTNFSKAKNILEKKKFDGIVLDLGVSSMQLDSSIRGFSFKRDGPLDMRMGDHGLTALEFIESASEENIANVIYKYGEEVQSRQIARGIVKVRSVRPIKTTLQLAEIVRGSMHYRNSKIDPVTKTFQAIRIYINNELDSIQQFLEQSAELLNAGGRIVVVSFHSLEDKIIKTFFKEHSIKKTSHSKYSKKIHKPAGYQQFRIITKKPIIPSKEEVILNPRSRSARLRVAEKYI